MRKLCAVLVAALLVTVGSAYATFEGVDTTKRNITVAANIDEENVALAATTVIPGTAGGFTGFVANDTTKLAADLDVITRVQVSRELVAGWDVNLYGEMTRRDSIGIERQIATGFFVSKVTKIGAVTANFGVGNYVERERERADLGLTASDADTVRAMAYARIQYRNVDVLVKATPKVNGNDIRVLVNPTIDVGNGISISTEWYYDSDPSIEGNMNDLGATVQVNKDF